MGDARLPAVTAAPPDPVEAAKVNSRRALLTRFRDCATERKQLPNVMAVDFTSIGDFYPAVNELNAAVARMTGAADFVDRLVRKECATKKLTPAELSEIRGFRRLPKVSTAKARRLLGPIADTLGRSPLLDVLEQQNDLPPTTTTTSSPRNASAR